MNWQDLEAQAPEIARPGKERFEQTRVALLGTLGSGGSPRISPVEPYLSQGHLLFGAMSRSLKAADLLRDPRCVLHSAITGPDNGEGELKVYGRAVLAPDQIRNGCNEGWWITAAYALALVFSINIEQATFVSWDLMRSEMTVRRWSPEWGFTKATRRYP